MAVVVVAVVVVVAAAAAGDNDVVDAASMALSAHLAKDLWLHLHHGSPLAMSTLSTLPKKEMRKII